MNKLLLGLILLIIVPPILLTAGIVAGAAFATIQGQCTQTINGFTADDVIIENVQLNTEGEMVMEIRNGASSTIHVQSVRLEEESFSISETSINVGRTESIKFGDFEDTDECNDMDIEIIYDRNAENLSATGSLTDSIE